MTSKAGGSKNAGANPSHGVQRRAVPLEGNWGGRKNGLRNHVIATRNSSGSRHIHRSVAQCFRLAALIEPKVVRRGFAHCRQTVASSEKRRGLRTTTWITTSVRDALRADIGVFMHLMASPSPLCGLRRHLLPLTPTPLSERE